MRTIGCFFLIFFLISCGSKKTYRILGNIEDPQNEIAIAVASILNRNLKDTVVVSPGIGSFANIDSLILGKADFAIVDNYASYHSDVSSIMPVYAQVLHILHRKNYLPRSLPDLLANKKVFAGAKGSGSWLLVNRLMSDYDIDPASVQMLDVIDLFEADVIIAFTDLLSPDELRDLKDYTLFSLDDVDKLGKGSLAEGLCTRYPQFSPYIIARNAYGEFTPATIVTLRIEALLVCRSSLDDDFILSVIEQLSNNKQEIAAINPLLYKFSGNFDPDKLSFALHSGTRKYLSRNEPGFIERNIDFLGVLFSVVLTLASAFFSIAKWQRMRKKDKIDVYYAKLIALRIKIPATRSTEEVNQLDDELRSIQEETIGLVTAEKLSANESFSIFLSLSRLIMEEIRMRAQQLLNHSL